MGPDQDTGSFDAFRVALRDAVAHLYDPTYEPSGLLWTWLGCVPSQGVEAIQSILIDAIRDLAPGGDVPSGARIRRIYELLFYRYVECLTQEETADRLDITARHLRREQQEAIDVLARRLRQQARLAPVPGQTSVGA